MLNFSTSIYVVLKERIKERAKDLSNDDIFLLYRALISSQDDMFGRLFGGYPAAYIFP
jgi:hypothetical protein